MQKTSLSFSEISRRLRALALPEVDLVLGIATGGTVPASLVAHQLGCEMLLVHVNYRDENNAPRYPEPVQFIGLQVRFPVVGQVRPDQQQFGRPEVGVVVAHEPLAAAVENQNQFILPVAVPGGFEQRRVFFKGRKRTGQVRNLVVAWGHTSC